MTRQVLMRSPPVRRRQSYISEDSKTPQKGKKYGELVGGTAAECTAVCCCCPFTVMELLVLGLYKVPTGLCKKMWRKKKRKRLMKQKLGFYVPAKAETPSEEPESELDLTVVKGEKGGDNHDDGCTGAVDLEKEMLDRFYGAGFWRNPSQRDT